jgi:Tfp pilus assembly protein PilO
MTGRDRMVLIGVIVVVVLVAAWMTVVSPERQQASKLSAEVAAAQATLSSAQGKLASARTAQSQYASAYAALVGLGKAVPPKAEVPALIDQLAQASSAKSVDFSSITAGGSGSSSSAATASSSAAGISDQPFTFVFEGSFFDLEHLLQRLTDFATLTPAGDLQVSGRLLTIQSVKLSPTSSSSAQGAGAASNLTGTIAATAYVLPAAQGLTATSTASATGAATPASSTGATTSSPTAPAVVTVDP